MHSKNFLFQLINVILQILKILQFDSLSIKYQANFKIGQFQIQTNTHILFYFTNNMDYIEWKEITTPNILKKQPATRWAHSSCTINENIIIFGGYAHSNYMNDLWCFNTTTFQWSEIQTTGQIPNERSNCTMHYDAINNQIIVFGGGARNKERFNSISILDWNTKIWIEITPSMNQHAPWQRTYHTSQLVYPYLILFGGQGVEDLNDLWIFNFQTLSWKQVKIIGEKPSPRKFHTSAILKNKLYIIGGCCQEYKLKGQVYQMDLTALLEKQDIEGLTWKKIQFKNNKHMIYRWGHSTNVFNNKIYMIGGRNKQNLNDIVQINPQNQMINYLNNEANKRFTHRRRHTSQIIGSCLVIFGGYSGYYYNDLHFCNLFTHSIIENSTKEQKMVEDSIYNPEIELSYLMKDEFIRKISKQYGDVAVLSKEDFQRFLWECNQPYYFDISIKIGKKVILANKTQIVSRSLYFKNLLENNYMDIQASQTGDLILELPEFIQSGNINIIQIVIHYLSFGKLVIYDQFTIENWLILCKIANYLCLEHLLQICDRQLCQLLDKKLFKTLDFAIQYDLMKLAFMSVKAILQAYPSQNLVNFLCEQHQKIEKCSNKLKIYQQFKNVEQLIKLQLKHDFEKLKSSKINPAATLTLRDNNRFNFNLSLK